MRRVYKLLFLIFVCIFLFGCKREANSPEDYQEALDSIKFDFDLDNINNDVKLPTKTKKYDLEILWELHCIESDEENYYVNCASLNLSDGTTSIIHKISYDGNYDDRLFGRATLVANIFDKDNNYYAKEYTITVYEKIPSLSYTIKQIKEFCSFEASTYLEATLTIAWIKEATDNIYNIILTDGNDHIFVNGAYYNNRYDLKNGDKVKVRGMSSKYNGCPVVTSNEKHQCSVELVEKGKNIYGAQEIAYSDFGKIKTSDSSVYLMFVKFDGILKEKNDGSDYSYYIEGTKNIELIVNVSNYSFNHNNVANDKSAKKYLDSYVGIEATITGFIFANTDGVWEIIIIPSEIK